MKSKIIDSLKFIVFLCLGLFLLWFALKGSSSNVYENLNNIAKGFKQADYRFVILALIIGLSGHYSRALRWNILMKPLGYKTTNRDSFLAVLIGYMVNFALPRMGEVSRCVVVSKKNNIPMNKTLGTVFTERVFDLTVLLLFILLMFIIEFKKIKDLFYDQVYIPLNQNLSISKSMLLFIIIFAVVLGIFVLWGILKYIKSKAKTNDLAKKINDMLLGFFEGIKTIKTMKKKWLFLFHTLYIWLTYWITIYIVFWAVKGMDGLGLKSAFVILIISSIGMVFPAPGGIGSFHFAVIKGLTLYKPIAVSAQTWHNISVQYAFLSHSSQMLLLIIGGGISYFLITFLMRKKTKT